MILLPQKVAYRGTISSLRISSVDGTAFLDNCAALVPYADGNHLIEIYDSSNRMLKGVLKAAGTGETLGEDLLASWDLTSGWATLAATINDADSFTTAGAGGVRKATIGTAGSSVKITAAYATTAPGMGLMNYGNTTTYLPDFSAGGYITLIDATGVYLRNAWAGQTDITSMSIEPVLTPSSSGATIVSAKGGATQSFATVQAGFAYNAAAYSVVVRKAR